MAKGYNSVSIVIRWLIVCEGVGAAVSVGCVNGDESTEATGVACLEHDDRITESKIIALPKRVPRFHKVFIAQLHLR